MAHIYHVFGECAYLEVLNNVFFSICVHINIWKGETQNAHKLQKKKLFYTENIKNLFSEERIKSLRNYISYRLFNPYHTRLCDLEPKKAALLLAL